MVEKLDGKKKMKDSLTRKCDLHVLCAVVYKSGVPEIIFFRNIDPVGMEIVQKSR